MQQTSVSAEQTRTTTAAVLLLAAIGRFRSDAPLAELVGWHVSQLNRMRRGLAETAYAAYARESTSMRSLTKPLYLARLHPARIHPGILSRFEKRIDDCPALLSLPSRLWVLLYFLTGDGTPNITSARSIRNGFIAAILAARSQRSWGASSVEQRRRLANFVRRHLSRLDDEGVQLMLLTLLRARHMKLSLEQVLFEAWWRPKYRPHRNAPPGNSS